MYNTTYITLKLQTNYDIFLGSNDKSVIVWDVKGEFDLNGQFNDSNVCSYVNCYYYYYYLLVRHLLYDNILCKSIRFQVIKSVENVKNGIVLEVSLREKLNKFTNAVNSCDFSSNHKCLVAAGR